MPVQISKEIGAAMATQVDRVNRDADYQARRIAELESIVREQGELIRRLRNRLHAYELDTPPRPQPVIMPCTISVREAARRDRCSVSTVIRHLNNQVKQPRFFGALSGSTWMVYADNAGVPLSVDPAHPTHNKKAA